MRIDNTAEWVGNIFELRIVCDEDVPSYIRGELGHDVDAAAQKARKYCQMEQESVGYLLNKLAEKNRDTDNELAAAHLRISQLEEALAKQQPTKSTGEETNGI